MAKLSAHNRTQIGNDIEDILRVTRIMSDGHILHNTGNGWVDGGKISQFHSPLTAYNALQGKMTELDEQFPHAADYRDYLHRWAVPYWNGIHIAVKECGNDAAACLKAITERFQYGNKPKITLEDCERLIHLITLLRIERKENA